MIKHSENRKLPYSADEMVNLVADIESYPEFIPWCEAVRINSVSDISNDNIQVINADMLVSFKIFRETLTSEVTIDFKKKSVLVSYVRGPFKFLRNSWVFKNLSNECLLSFDVEFEFKSKLMQRVTGLFFQEAMKKIVKAFEKRAETLYGKL